VLFPAALWRVGGVRWIALALNALLLISTPAYGSHYVVDVVAGIAVATACWIAVGYMLDVASRSQPEHLSTIYDPPSIVPEAPSAPAAAALSREFESPESRLPAA
jgi:hypothetical protein